MKKCNGKYSIWLMPEREKGIYLTQLIHKLSEKYNSPFFKPHVTLIGDLSGEKKDLIIKTKELESSIQPYKIKLTTIKGLEEYFKSVFVKVEKTKDIMKANLKAREIFNKNSDSDYMPHLSLIYGNFPQKIKEEIISEIGDNLNLEFKVDKLHLFSTTENVENWYEVE